jgi:hypothetical protein
MITRSSDLSLKSSAWGARGRGFESRRPDQLNLWNIKRITPSLNVRLNTLSFPLNHFRSLCFPELVGEKRGRFSFHSIPTSSLPIGGLS